MKATSKTNVRASTALNLRDCGKGHEEESTRNKCRDRQEHSRECPRDGTFRRGRPGVRSLARSGLRRARGTSRAVCGDTLAVLASIRHLGLNVGRHEGAVRTL
jgi:hypothetical protein